MKVLALLLLAAACSQSAVETSDPEVPLAQEKVESSGIPESDVPAEVTGGCLQNSCTSGNAQIVYIPEKQEYELRSKGKRLGTLALSYDASTAEMEKISLVTTKTQYVVVYQYGSESMASQVDSFEAKGLAKKWALQIPGFNLGFAAKGNSLYVSTNDFIGKINLKKGQYVWQHSGLHKRYDYSGPDHIRIYEKEVRFLSNQKVLKVDSKSGKLLP